MFGEFTFGERVFSDLDIVIVAVVYNPSRMHTKVILVYTNNGKILVSVPSYELKTKVEKIINERKILVSVPSYELRTKVEKINQNIVNVK